LPGRIRRALGELPDSLDGTYERTLLDIDEQNWEYAHRLFQCITVASRPLRVEELAEFLAFDFDEGENPKFDASWRPDDPNGAVLSTCSSLIAVVNVGDTAVVQFAHFSVKEFLTSNRIARGRVSRYYILLEPAHLTIARACLAFLLSLDGSVNKTTIGNLPLAFYAARYWQGHTKFGNVSPHTQEAMQRIFDPTEPYFLVWTWLEHSDMNRDSISEAPTIPRTSPLHRAVLDSLIDVAEWLITSRSQDPDELHRGKTQLYWASQHGNLRMAQLLIKHGADVNAQHVAGWHPLHIASCSGHLETLRLLIGSGADVNSRDGDWTALYLAAEEGHLEVVRVLLENGADPNVQRRNGTSFHRAWKNGHLDVAELLLKYGADINTPCMYGETLLHRAAKNGDQKIALQLLERGANIHTRSYVGKTPLQIALAWGDKDMVQLLLQYDTKKS
jgi:ankyrin repeat protein